jgi:glycosyltransferase involved in cell wall biosynthesis
LENGAEIFGKDRTVEQYEKRIKKMERSKLAIFLPSLRGGGVEKMRLNLAGSFVARGLDVDLVLQRAEGVYLSQIPPGVRLIDLRARRIAFSLCPLVAYLRREKPQVLLSGMTHTNDVALLARRLARVNTRVVVSEHSAPGISSCNEQNLRQRFVLSLARLIYPWADGVVAVSKGVADDVAHALRFPRTRITVIHNPASSPEILKKAKEPLEHTWFSAKKEPVILGAGRLTWQKDFSTLLRAFAVVRKKRAVRLVILGEGEERGRLAALAEELGVAESVDMLGFVDNPYKYMARAAVFVLSSRKEGFGNVLVEALACGTPVVSTDCPSGPAEILEDGRYGELVPVGDYEALARSILSTLDNPISASVLQERARDFSVEKIADQYEAMFLGC